MSENRSSKAVDAMIGCVLLVIPASVLAVGIVVAAAFAAGIVTAGLLTGGFVVLGVALGLIALVVLFFLLRWLARNHPGVALGLLLAVVAGVALFCLSQLGLWLYHEHPHAALIVLTAVLFSLCAYLFWGTSLFDTAEEREGKNRRPPGGTRWRMVASGDYDAMMRASREQRDGERSRASDPSNDDWV